MPPNSIDKILQEFKERLIKYGFGELTYITLAPFNLKTTVGKNCLKCGIFKKWDEFSKATLAADRHINRCRKCDSYFYLKRYRGKLEFYQERNRQYNKKNRDKKRINEIKTAKRYPEKAKARLALRYAVKIGKIKKLPCKVCLSIKSQAHHPDYSKPLEVIWLCTKHHAQEHRKYK